MDDLRLAIGLVWVDCQKVHVGRQQLPRRLPVTLHKPAQRVLGVFIPGVDLLRHLQWDGDLLIVREVLPHIGKRQERGVLQQEPGKYQRRYAGQLPALRFPPAYPAVGVVLRVYGFIGFLHHTVLCVKVAGPAVAFAVLVHQAENHPVEQMEDTGAVAVDESGRHAHELLADAENLRHSVALAAVIVVLMKLISQETIDPAPVLFLDVSTQREPADGSRNWERVLRVICDLLKLVLYCSVFGSDQIHGCPLFAYPSEIGDLRPGDIPARNHRSP